MNEKEIKRMMRRKLSLVWVALGVSLLLNTYFVFLRPSKPTVSQPEVIHLDTRVRPRENLHHGSGVDPVRRSQFDDGTQHWELDEIQQLQQQQQQQLQQQQQQPEPLIRALS